MKKPRFLWIGLLLVTCNTSPAPEMEAAVKKLMPYSDEAFVLAIMRGDKDQVHVFLEGTINPNAKNRFGDTALHWAVYSDLPDLTRTLLQRGADPNISGTDHKTPIFWTARAGNAKLTKLLLDRGSQIQSIDKRGATPLHHAVYSGDVPTIKTLIQAGARVNAQDHEGRTPLHIAAAEGESDALEPLIAAGADLFIANHNNRTALQALVKAGFHRILLDSAVVRKTYPDIEKAIDEQFETIVDNAHQQPLINTNRVALLVHEKVNLFRAKLGLTSLDYDDRLAQIAALHSKDMADHAFIDHVNPRGEDPTRRAESAGYEIIGKTLDGQTKIGLGENIYQGHLFKSSSYYVQKGVKHVEHVWLQEQELAEAAVQGWIESPGHRRNLLGAQYSRQGVGIAIGQDQKVFITQNLW
ncbi:MAG: ankyrin repeat domain-containing protein [Acidobacteria bacterium]|nr:ankyrin repeat domain-containing protein [Acidobacteriota bacterium]